MPRKRRSIKPEIPVHIVQRGVDRRRTFEQPKDFRAYLAALGETSDTYEVAIHAYVLMNNHVHLLATPALAGSASRMMQQLGRKYVCYFNGQYNRTGTLWEGRFRSSVIDSDRYLFACYRYIEMNPVRAGLVSGPGQWLWSSYRVNAMSRPNRLVQPHDLWLGLGNDQTERCRNYQRMFDDSTHQRDDELRTALQKGRRVS